MHHYIIALCAMKEEQASHREDAMPGMMFADARKELPRKAIGTCTYGQ